MACHARFAAAFVVLFAVSGCGSRPAGEASTTTAAPAESTGQAGAAAPAQGVEQIVRAWLAETEPLSDYVDPAHGVGVITYYAEMADPPEAHPETNEQGYVELAEASCDPAPSLERLRALLSSLGLSQLECEEATKTCFYPAPDGGGGFELVFREESGRLVLDLSVHYDGGYDEEGTARRDAWLEAQRTRLAFEARSCP